MKTSVFYGIAQRRFLSEADLGQEPGMETSEPGADSREWLQAMRDILSQADPRAAMRARMNAVLAQAETGAR